MKYSNASGILAAAFLGLSVGGALAADLPSRVSPTAPVAAQKAEPAAANWTGAYAGVTAGWADADVKRSGFSAGSGDGLRAGVFAGYSADVTGTGVILGAEADVAYNSIKMKSSRTVSATPSSVVNAEHETQWMSTLRGRAGYAFGNVLPYVTLGGAVLGVEDSLVGSVNNVVTSRTSGSGTFYGYVAGAGVEMMLAANVAARLEYLYLDVPKQDMNSAANSRVSLRSNMLNAGVSYRF